MVSIVEVEKAVGYTSKILSEKRLMVNVKSGKSGQNLVIVIDFVLLLSTI